MELVIKVLVLTLLVLCCWSESVEYNKTSSESCFSSCKCEDEWYMVCFANAAFVQNVPQFNRYMLSGGVSAQTRVHFITVERTVPTFIRHLPVLHDLSLEKNIISTVQTGSFNGMRLKKLNLSGNTISTIQPESFSDLSALKTLDLSHNLLTSLDKNIFSQMPALEELNLDHNNLRFFPFDTSSVVPNLKVLMLNYNRLSYLVPTHLSMLPSLHILGLRNNRLQTFVINLAEEMPSLQVLNVAGNPFHCSCGVVGLKGIAEGNSTSLMDPENTTCASPPSMVDRSVVDAFDQVLGECAEPSVFQNFNSRQVLYTTDVEVGCDAAGEPHPAVLWHTPWGDEFADSVNLPVLEDICHDCKVHRKYHGIGISLVSEVSVLNGGRVLKITAFRGFFNGNITCTAFSFLGNVTATRYVEVYSAVQPTIRDSLVIGGFSAAGFLSFGLIVGSIKLVVLACKKRFGPKNIVHSPAPVSEGEKTSSMAEEGDCREDSIDFDDEFYPPETPFTTPVANSPSTSPKKYHSPTEDGEPPGGWLPNGIFDTVEEVRWRLRYGVGRKMIAVKRNVRSMKESGSVYVHNIMESGSTAANKVKAGVVMGVETVKYHVQSIKEFCGTGDMGAQTISMISVETNIDTNETREVVKSVTFV